MIKAMSSTMVEVWVRAAVQRYGHYAALYLVGFASGPVDPLELIINGTAHPVRVLIPPHHLKILGHDTAKYGFRCAVAVDSTLTAVRASLVGRGRGGSLIHDLGRLLVPQAAPAHVVGASTPALSPRPFLRSRRRTVLVAPHMGGTGGAQWWLGEVVEALERTSWADVDALDPARIAGGPLGLAVAQDDNGFEGAVARRIGELIDREPDVVVVNTVEGLATAEACRRLAVPFCWAIHESYAPPVLWASVFEFETPSTSAVDALERCLASADTVLFVAEETRALLGPHVRSGRSCVVRFRAGRGAGYRAVARCDRHLWQVPDDAFLVLSVSTLEERKNPGLLVAAMAHARRSVPNLHLLLAGPGSSAYGDWLTSLAKYEGLGAAFTHVRDKVDIDELLPLADLYVSASDIESRPVVLLEAMAAGVPILATRACGVAELIDDDIDGLLCRMGDREALAEAVVALAGAPDRRFELARRASARVESLPGDWADAVVVAIASAAQL